MKAILVNPDKSLVWSDVPDPVVGDEDVLVEIHCAALNRADLMQREGDYPPPPGCPEWMGLEISGVIVKMGKIAEERSPYRLGDQVCALLGGGGYAEYANVKYDMLMPVPKNRTLVEAAAMPEAYATAYLNLFIEGKAKAGDTLLMNAGSVRSRVCRHPDGEGFRTQGHHDRPLRRVRRERQEDRRGYRRRHEQGGHPRSPEGTARRRNARRHRDRLPRRRLYGGCLQYLSHGARWIMIAALAGRFTEIDLKNIYVRNVRIIGSTLRSRTPAFKAELLASLVKNVWPKVEEGLLKPSIYKVLPIQRAEEAHSILERGENVGKVVLTVKD